MTTLLCRSYLISRLHYDPMTGIFIWKEMPIKHWTSGTWNKKFAGRTAGKLHPNGYRQIKVDAQSYYAHRLAWFYITGKWPAKEIDHKNGCRDDNRLDNLRECTRAENRQNNGVYRVNTSGLTGAFWSKQSKTWWSMIKVGGRQVYLGQFETREAAHDAYLAAKSKYHHFQPVPRDLAA